MKTVASISFKDDHSLSLDVIDVTGIAMGGPLKIDDATWVVEMVVNTRSGKIALQMVGDSPDSFTVVRPELLNPEGE
ncbi:MAG: hypothetical protein K9H25_01200 [Rhodospirillum sp.]|nr:hypothetical protein [Rhodospirillum sp.]MCF8488061.1 hypothetical protein [Rhodospirillum sp.]MCF8502208.1 hypothetical protein [Rhodospirillum sp.]